MGDKVSADTIRKTANEMKRKIQDNIDLAEKIKEELQNATNECNSVLGYDGDIVEKGSLIIGESHRIFITRAQVYFSSGSKDELQTAYENYCDSCDDYVENMNSLLDICKTLDDSADN